MQKLNYSIAAQRQIPEYIKNNYPLFVEFVKAYYEFLQQTQQKNLEGYRSIDTTLEDFLVKFKSELSENIPVELAQDKRELLRNLREFYLSRGSEASYKFLFKVLFEKNASLFYPSSQILRVSDGRWIQENSIFVRTTDPNKTLFALKGKFVEIKTETRKLSVYISNVVEYKSDIYELSILNTEVNQFITVGSTVSYKEAGVRYTGTILKSPSKISIIKRGKGFSLGDIFSLKTDLGRGCLVKVTSVDENGGLKGISLIQFGLDYETTFWSYLAPGQVEGFEYIQPTTLYTNGTIPSGRVITNASKVKLPDNSYRVTITTAGPHNLQFNTKITVTTGLTSIDGTHDIIYDVSSNDTTFSYLMNSGPELSSTAISGTLTKPYLDSSDGFLEYGYAVKQNYLSYDSSIPVEPNIGAESDRYYVDSSYVGDIVTQFFNEQESGNLYDDYAVVQIEVGAVAKYPGYYSASNGFISDESFIQDGYYYQIYSYVLRVEEEFRKYSDLVKNILHPAGLKLFAEYDIYNYIDLSATEDFSRNFIQFSDSVSNIFDQGFGYSSTGAFSAYENTISLEGPDYTTTIDLDGNEVQTPLTITVTPKPGFFAIFNSEVGRPALHARKPRYDTYSFYSSATGRMNYVSYQGDLGYDALEKYHLEKNANETISSGISELDIATTENGFGHPNGTIYNLIFSEPTLSSGLRSSGTATWNGDTEGNGSWTISMAVEGSGYILNPNNIPEVTISAELAPPSSLDGATAPSFSVESLYDLSTKTSVSFIKAHDVVFGQSNFTITSTTTDLSIFSEGDELVIYGARKFANNGSVTVFSSSQNQLVVTGNQFTAEDVSVSSGEEYYEVTITRVLNKFNEYQTPSSSGYGYPSYVTTIDSLGNPISIPNTTSKVYTRNVTQTIEENKILWNAEQIDIYDTPENYKSHSAYYMSINSYPRTQLNVTSYYSDGSTTVIASIANTESIEVGDLIRIYGNTTANDKSNLNGVWIITGVTSNSISFEIKDVVLAGTYSTNIGTAVTWRPNAYFTDQSIGASSSFGYTSYQNLIDSLGNTIVYPLDSSLSPIISYTQFVDDLLNDSNKVYSKNTTHLSDYKTVDVSQYGSHSSHRLSKNSFPRSTISIISYSTNGTTTVTANVLNSSSLEVGDKIIIKDITLADPNTFDARANLMGTWTITEKPNSTSFKFEIYSSIPTALYSTNIGTAVTWRPNENLTDSQELESTGYSFDSYVNAVHNTSAQNENTIDEFGVISSISEVYSGSIVTDLGIEEVKVYVSIAGDSLSERVYSGNSTRNIIVDSGGNSYTQILGNTSNTSELPHSSQRLNKIKIDPVEISEEGRVVLNAYNEEAFFNDGYYAPMIRRIAPTTYTSNGTTTLIVLINDTSSIRVGDTLKISNSTLNVNGSWPIISKTAISISITLDQSIASGSYTDETLHIGDVLLYASNYEAYASIPSDGNTYGYVNIP